MAFKSQATKEAEKRIKQTKKETENKEMKTKLTTIAKYVATVIVTLAVVFGLYTLYQTGVDHGKSQQKQINKEVATQVADLKPNQK